MTIHFHPLLMPGGKMMNPEDPVRTKLQEARRKQILEAATIVFSEEGYHHATIHKVAAKAGVADGTIYNYFSSKEDLLIGIIKNLAELDQLLKQLSNDLSHEPYDAVLDIVKNRLDLIKANQKTILAILPEIMVNRYLRARFYDGFIVPVAEILEERLGGLFDDDEQAGAKKALMVRLVQSTIVGLLIFLLLEDKVLVAQWDQLPELLTDTIISNRILASRKIND
jgi:AcrR family transcriptional regulator